MPALLDKLPLSRLTIAQRLWLGLGLIFGLFAVADLASVWSAKKVDVALRNLTDQAEERRQSSLSMSARLAEIGSEAQKLVEDVDTIQPDLLYKCTDAFGVALSRYGARASSDDSRALAGQASVQYARLRRDVARLVQVIEKRIKAREDLAVHRRAGAALLDRMPSPANPGREAPAATQVIAARELEEALRAARMGPPIAREAADALRWQAQDGSSYQHVGVLLERYRGSVQGRNEQRWVAEAAAWYESLRSKARSVTALEKEAVERRAQLGTVQNDLATLLDRHIQPASRADLTAAVEKTSKAAHDAALGTTRALLLALILGGLAALAIMRAVKKAEARLHHLAYHDPLTDLPNRLSFAKRLDVALEQAIRSDRRVALLFIDLDQFKHINDTLGHDAGDVLLKEMARRLPACLNPNDLVARLSGDEFIVMMESIERPEQAAHLADQLRAAMSAPFELRGIELRMSASIGISLSATDGSTAEALLREADAAMYRAKGDGGSGHRFFSSELTQQAMEQLTFRNALRQPQLHEQLIVHYQPQVAIDTGRIVGVEALVRWQHPTLGLLSPAQFIPIAEQAGLVETIGQWVLQTACAQARAWMDRGYPPVKVAINVSPREIANPAIIERVERALADTGLHPSALELEITESALQSTAEALEVLSALRNRGVSLALDDFGTGYSSFGSMRSLPFHRLKIDRSFVRDLQTSRNDRSIVRAIIAVAQGLALETVAEGVETVAQLRILRDAGCQEVQGYLIGRPMPAAALDSQFPGRIAQLPTVGTDTTHRLSIVRAANRA
jgi:diguanylate cyclase (GGDEF)-like protein